MNSDEILIKNNPLISDRINLMYERLGCVPIDIHEDWTPYQVVDEIMKHIV